MNEPQPPQTVVVQAHGMRWRAAADFAEALPLLGLEKVRRPERLAEAELVRDRTVRTVARLPHPAGADRPCLYVKRHKFSMLRRPLRSVLGRTKAAHEWRMARALLERGIPTCRLLAVAEPREGLLRREAFLISEEIPGAVELRDYLAAGSWRMQGPSVKQQLIEELAELVVRFLRAGFYHHDLHAGNVLIAPGRAPGRRLFVVDLHSVWRRRPTRRRVLRMLVMLADSTKACGVSSGDRVRFLRAVLARWTGTDPARKQSVRNWAQEARSAWRKHHFRHMRSRTRRCTVESSEFTRDLAGRFRLWRRCGFSLDAALATVETHQKAVAGEAGHCEVRKTASRAQVSLCRLPGLEAVCVKAFLRCKPSERFKDLLRRRGRARAAWIAHRGYRVRGLPAARGLALVEARSKLSGTPDYLIVEALEVEGNLQELTGSLPPQAPEGPPFELTAGVRRELAVAVAGLFRLLAEQEVRHADMKPSNILAGRQGGRIRLWLVDLDRSRFDEAWKGRDWIKHLAQLNAGLSSQVTLLDRMRCLRQCGRGRWRPRERLALARAIIERSRQHYRPWLR